MKPIIGIINRYGKTENENEILYTYKEIIKKIKELNGIPIGINILDEKDINNLKIVNGIILQGGDTYKEEEIEIVKYAYEKNIPILGICQGMQIMGIAACGEIYKVKNHNKKNIKKVHKVIINKNTKLYEILKEKQIIVNSRHSYAIKKTTLEISGKTEDNIIEAIEDKSKDFFIGIEWHPESLEDKNSKQLFEYFIRKADEKYDYKRNIKSNPWENN